MKRSEPFSMRIFGLSIVMVLILLCLTVFGVLSLSSASAETALSEKNARQIENYALCDAEAQKSLAAVYAAAASISEPRELPALLDSLEFTSTFDGAGRVIVRFETAQQDRLSIAVTLTVGPGRKVSLDSYRLVVAQDPADAGQTTLWQG